MGKRIVIALGGNALGTNLPEQMLAVKETSRMPSPPTAGRSRPPM